MWRCKYCGGVADAAGCAHCGATAVEYVPNDVSFADEFDNWVEITCVGDKNQRFMHLWTGAIKEEPPQSYSRLDGLVLR